MMAQFQQMEALMAQSGVVPPPSTGNNADMAPMDMTAFFNSLTQQ